MSIIQNPKPLQHEFLPTKLIHRDQELEEVQVGVQQFQNVLIQGPRGIGKTVLAKQALEHSTTNSCYISCLEHDTQYKVLKQILGKVGRESTASGHHTSKLQRQLENQIDILETLIVLDDLDFLLLNDADDLLYFLSRLDTDLGLVLLTANHADLNRHLEERTYSTLQPQRIDLNPYTQRQAYQILADRAEKALKPQSLHQDALNHIVSRTQNLSLALTWLRIAAKNTGESITKSLIGELQKEAKQQYIQSQLDPFSSEHKALYRIITELTENSDSVSTGAVYQEYQDKSNDPLSNRRVSDLLKQLEQLNLITSNYHYGGSKGKTREIELTYSIQISGKRLV